MSKSTFYLKPTVAENGHLSWPEKCQATTKWLNATYSTNRDKPCKLKAKISHKGQLLCRRHASILILEDAIKGD